LAAREAFETIPDMWAVYGEPCSNCVHYSDGVYCVKGHSRQKTVRINMGHIPDADVRRKGGCPDHQIKEGDWWNEDPIRPFSGEYGGSKTSII
jgi:hypothetical protein